MVLVDTSIWIRFISNQSPHAAGLDRLLNRGEVWAHDLVYGELLIGDRGGRRQLLADYALLPQAPVRAHREVVTIVRDRGLHGRGIGWTDAHLLASALRAGLALSTADSRLADLASELRIAHEA